MPRAARNVLFIMCDQLRADHLSCYGHPRLHTPHLDALAAKGVLFEHAYVQSPVCGPSRMSYCTGRYMHAHGVSWNFVPLKVGEMTIGDHLHPLGVRSVLIGKTHMRGDASGLSRLGIDPASPIGVRIAECGFDPFERDDGIHPIRAMTRTRTTTATCASTASTATTRGKPGPTPSPTRTAGCSPACAASAMCRQSAKSAEP